MLTFIPVSFLF